MPYFVSVIKKLASIEEYFIMLKFWFKRWADNYKLLYQQRRIVVLSDKKNKQIKVLSFSFQALIKSICLKIMLMLW